MKNSKATNGLPPLQFLIVLLLLVSGCASTNNKPYDADLLGKIQEGVTTKAEVRKLLGEPNGVSKGSNGAETWSYQATNSDTGKRMGIAAIGQGIGSFVPGAGLAGAGISSGAMLSGGKTKIRGTTIQFDENGVVTSFGTSSNSINTSPLQ